MKNFKIDIGYDDEFMVYRREIEKILFVFQYSYWSRMKSFATIEEAKIYIDKFRNLPEFY